MKTTLPNNSTLLFTGIVGSQSYGLATETSDTDYKSIYIQSDKDILSNNYVPQIEINKDNVAYELRRFLELVSTGNPNVLELLFLPERYIVKSSPEYEYLRSIRTEFLSKKCYNTYSGYAKAQLQKASGLNKKFNWKENRVKRKDIYGFAKVVDKETGDYYKLKEWLDLKGYSDRNFRLTKLEGFRDCYKIYLGGYYVPEDSNEPKTCIVEKDVKYDGFVYWNRESYSTHCKEYLEYKKWLKNRNENRVATNKKHGQKFDAKNILHLVRLIMTAEEIPTHNTINVDRSKERDYLLSIKRGDIDLKEVVSEWSERVEKLKDVYKNSNLKEEVNLDYIKNLEYELRNYKK